LGNQLTPNGNGKRDSGLVIEGNQRNFKISPLGILDQGMPRLVGFGGLPILVQFFKGPLPPGWGWALLNWGGPKKGFHQAILFGGPWIIFAQEFSTHLFLAFSWANNGVGGFWKKRWSGFPRFSKNYIRDNFSRSVFPPFFSPSALGLWSGDHS